MAKYRLGDICEIVSGSTPKSGVADYWDGGIKWITPAELNDDSYIVNDTVRKISPLGVQKTGLTPFPAGTVILSSRAPIGKVAIAGCEMYCNQGFKNLICSDIIDNRFLYWFLKSKTDYLNSLGRGATFKEISKQIVAFIEIDVPPIKQQLSIVKQLEKANEIIKYRKQELLAFDTLIKARFVEMFGNPVINPKGYPIVPISELFDVGSSKRVFESEWRDEGVPFYRAREIVKLSKDGFVDNELFIDEELYEKYKTKYGVPNAGDMMVTGVGTLGVCYIVRPADRFYFKDGNTLWFKNKGLCNVRFIMEQYETDFVRSQIDANANVSTVGTYTITNANNTMVLVPTLEEQNEFDSFVKQIDKSKTIIQAALNKDQLLLDSFMQTYFC